MGNQESITIKKKIIKKNNPIIIEKQKQNIQNIPNIQNISNIQNIPKNTLIERNMQTDIIIKHNNIFDYPSNSNNEVDIPKKNIENIEFTPYNFTDEINKFKKNITTERIDFENKEKERRHKFEQNQKNKEQYLDNQIQNFEKKYNPWEILGLEYKDYNINNIKKAYKKCALKYHPDRAGNKYQDKFQLITQSYIYLLGKAEENNELDIKINKNVENIDYGDDINESVENIYINKDNFNINQFNKIFDQYKIPSSFDKGYGDMSKEDISEQQVFGKKFNNDIFNAHFDTVKNKKIGNELIQYEEPLALDSSISNMSQSFLGMDDINDFGSMNNNNLSYTDYKKAHVNENLLIDINKVKYKTYNSIDQLESDRSNISYVQSNDDRKRYENIERKKKEDDDLRLMQQKNYDELIGNQYRKINQRLIIHK